MNIFNENEEDDIVEIRKHAELRDNHQVGCQQAADVINRQNDYNLDRRQTGTSSGQLADTLNVRHAEASTSRSVEQETV